jgi:hypothetical protein
MGLVTRRQVIGGASAMALAGGWRGGVGLAHSVADAANPAPASRFRWTRHPMLQADLDRALFVRALAKPVANSRIIDDMESDRGWAASPAVTLSYTTERARQGRRSLRFRTEQRNPAYIRASRSANGSFSGQGALFDTPPWGASARLRFAAPQNWSGFNRISFWCYPHPNGSPFTSLSLQFLCEGAPSGPADPVAVTYFADLKPGEWNHLAWEIPEMPRDRVTELVLFQPIAGVPFRDAASTLTYDIDQLRLERVAAEPVAGWTIAPGRISYCHLGYAPDAPKIALTSEAVASFELIDGESGAPLHQLAAERVHMRRGAYSVLDFSHVTAPGLYRLRTAGAVSDPFPIGDRPWRDLAEAVLNAFYGMRCGFAVPGAHDACHCDVFASYRGERRIVGGGWHDAANLSQDLENTHVSICALFDLAEALRPVDRALSDRAIEEARWGLEWVLRMRFGPGVRYLMGRYSYFTDGVAGTDDDVVDQNVGSDTFFNLTAALAEARGAQAFRATDPAFATELLRAAEEDFATVLRDRPDVPNEAGEPDWHAVPWQNEAGYIALTALALNRATGEPRYADTAARAARWLLDLQETRFIDGAPITGYFYADAARTRILHESQRLSGAPNSFEEGGLLALKGLCEAFPDHPDWMRWYAGLLIYAEFYCRKGAEASAPFAMVPAAVWRRADLHGTFGPDKVGEILAQHPNPLFSTAPTRALVDTQIAAMFEAGTPLAPDQRLRTFPLYTDHIRHGGTTVHLTKTIGLAAAAQARGDRKCAGLAARQLQWITGANPFSRSLVYGVGYDWWQNFTGSLPNFVGGLAVGINSYRDDAPAWGNNAVFPYKELWVLSGARLAAVLAHLPGTIELRGQTVQDAEFINLADGRRSRIPAGAFARYMAPGRYRLTYGDFVGELNLIDGCSYALSLDATHAIEIELVADPAARLLRLRARGRGKHDIELRASNVSLGDRTVSLKLDSDARTIEIPFDIIDDDRPWIVLAVPDRRIAEAVEAFGTALSLADLSSPAT